MRQLTSLDAQFLAMETANQYGHVGGLAVLDPSTRPGGLDLASVHELIGQRLPPVPPLRWRLAEVPLSLDYSYWVDDPDFDLEFHVREIALPAPGNEAQLAERGLVSHSGVATCRDPTSREATIERVGHARRWSMAAHSTQ